MFLTGIFKQKWWKLGRINYLFCQQHLTPNHQLSRKIAASATWQDLVQIYQQHQKQFNSQTFQLYRTKIQELLQNQKQVVDFNAVSEITQNIVKTNINALSENEIISLCYILKQLQPKGYNPQILQKFKTRLLEKYSNFLLNDNQSKNNVSKMMQAYELFNFFKWYSGCISIMDHLFKMINPEKPNLHLFTKAENFSVFKCLSQKQDLSLTEKKVRSYLLQSVCQRLGELQKSEVIFWLSQAMKMDSFDYTLRDTKFIRVLVNEVAKYGSDLEYEQALKLVESESQLLQVFLKVYDQVSDYIFQRIANDGTASVREQELLNLLKKISFKFRFQRLSETNKLKFFNFLQKYGTQLRKSKDVQRCLLFFQTIKQLVKHNFIFYDTQKQSKIIELMLIEGLPVSSNVLLVLQSRKIDIGPFIPDVVRTLIKSKLDVEALDHIILVDRICSKQKYHQYKPLLQDHKVKLNLLLEKTFSDDELFVQAFYGIFQFFTHSEVVFAQFHRNYAQFFTSMVNPFQVEESKTSNLYKILYVQYLTFAFYTADLIAFFQKYQSKIKPKIIAKLINRHYSDKQPRLNLLTLCHCQLQLMSQSKDRDVFQEIIFVAGKYHRFVLYGNMHKNIEQMVFKLLNSLFRNIQLIQQLNLEHQFLQTMEKYFTANFKNYHNEINYRQLLTNALEMLPRFKDYKPAYLIKEGLRLNLLTKDMLKNVEINKLGLSFNEKHMINYLLNPNYLPKIDVINFKTVAIALNNPNMSQFVNKNRREITEQLNRCHSDQLFYLITIFNQPRTQHSREVMLAMLQTLAARQDTIEKGNFVGALENLIKLNYYFFAACRQIIQKIVAQILPKISQYSLWTHERVINFIITQNGYKPQIYFQKLVEHYQTQQNQHSFFHILYLLSKTSYYFKSQQCKHIKPLLEHNLQRGISLFFATQSLIENPQLKGQILNAIVQQINDRSSKQSLSKLQYDYLKQKYPQQTRQLNRSKNQLFQDAFSLKPQPQTVALLELLAKQHNSKLQLLTQWGTINYIVRIKHWVFSFFHPKRQSSIHQHNFIKRALNLYLSHTSKEIVSIQLGVSKSSSMLQFLKRNYPQLVNETIFNNLSQKYSKEQSGKKQSTWRPKIVK